MYPFTITDFQHSFAGYKTCISHRTCNEIYVVHIGEKAIFISHYEMPKEAHTYIAMIQMKGATLTSN